MYSNESSARTSQLGLTIRVISQSLHCIDTIRIITSFKNYIKNHTKKRKTAFRRNKVGEHCHLKVPRNRTFPHSLKMVAICNYFSESYPLNCNNNLKNPQFAHNKYFCKVVCLAHEVLVKMLLSHFFFY